MSHLVANLLLLSSFSVLRSRTQSPKIIKVSWFFLLVIGSKLTPMGLPIVPFCRSVEKVCW